MATPELTAEDARCYIMFLEDGSSLVAYIGLYLPRSDRRFYYSSSKNPFSPSSLGDVEEEARAFVEDMGFVLDEIALASLSSAERSRWLDEQDIFTRKQAAPQQKAAAPTRQASAAAGQAWQPPVEAAQPSGAGGGQQWQPSAQPVSKPAAAQHRPQAAPEARSAQSVVGREKEALARLLASF